MQARESEQRHYPVSLLVFSVEWQGLHGQGRTIIHCALCVWPLGIFFVNVMLRMEHTAFCFYQIEWAVLPHWGLYLTPQLNGYGFFV